MKIKSLILEGFKSYGTRTTLQNFDKNFTAITGLNGSGKSNTLDAICFCLGLTRYKLARATKLQDLIYKSGQAGIKEAEVTIIFDNVDKTRSPEEFLNFDQVTFSRKILRNNTKFYINGKSVSNSYVKHLFHSMGLNIDNPDTFFVRQGRITKIVNFKPDELLKMIEEAAGISSFKKHAQESTFKLEKFEKRINNDVANMEKYLGPNMRILEKQKQIKDEYERLTRENKVKEENFKVEVFKNSSYQVDYLKKQIKICKKKKTKIENDIEEQKHKIKNFKTTEVSTESRQKYEKLQNDLKNLENKKDEIRKQILDAESKRESSASLKNGLQNQIDKFESKKHELNNTINENNFKIEYTLKDIGELKDNIASFNQILNESSESDSTEKLIARIRNVEDSLIRKQADIENFKKRIKENEKSILNKKKDLKRSEDLVIDLQSQIKTLNHEQQDLWNDEKVFFF